MMASGAGSKASGPGREAAGLAAGVDGGGTGSRAVILSADGREVARADGAPAAVAPAGSDEAARRSARVVTDLVRRALDTVAGTPGAARHTRGAADAAVDGARVSSVCAALAGAGDLATRERVEGALREAAAGWSSVLVVPDAEAARHDAFGDGPGIVLAAGTGAVAWGRGEDGRPGRSDGLGPVAGDEGSGFDLGRRALRAAIRAAEGRGPATELTEALADRAATANRAQIAALAPAVCDAARAGDPVAARLVGDAASRLAATAHALARKLGPWTSAPPLVFAGSLLESSDELRGALLRALPQGTFRWRDTPVDAARGAAKLARRAAEGHPPPPLP